MIKVVCFVGYSGTGKTTLLEKVVKELSHLGYKTGVIKSDAHGLVFDKQGKDTHRFRKSGADRVAAVGREEFFVYGSVKHESDLQYMINSYFQSFDIILIEGFKNSEYPKIEVNYSAAGKPFLGPEINNIKAVVSDKKPEKAVKHFAFSDTDKLIKYIIEILN